MQNYYILDNFPENHQLEEVPTQLWLLITLEVVISDQYGESILLTYPSYNLGGAAKMNILEEGYWAPPFFAQPIDIAYKSLDTVGSVMESFKEFETKINAKEQIGELAYVMGLPNPDIAFSGEFIELKRSPRSPNVWKCYKVLRYSCTNLGSRGRKNLADPECRKGYTFLPLYDLDNVLKDFNCQIHNKSERLFLSKPLNSNIDFVLKNESYLASLKSNAIKLNKDDFIIEEEGFILSFDLSGFGTVCKYATENMHSFTESGHNIATHFRESVAYLFYNFLSSLGIAQVQMAGDGFIAAFPKRHFIADDLNDVFAIIFKSYYSMLKKINEFNSSIKDSSKKVGSRLALNYGDYKYGRIAHGRSTSPDFDGANIIETARLEGGLREFTKGKDMIDVDLQFEHTVIVSENLFSNLHNQIFEENFLVFISEYDIYVKEMISKGHIFKISPQPLN